MHLLPCTAFLIIVFLLIFLSSTLSENISDEVELESQVINRVIKKCSLSENKYSCLANKAAVAVERAVQMDIPLFDGFVLARNAEFVDNATTPRSWNNGVSRLSNAVSTFLDSHTVKLDLTDGEPRQGDGNGGALGKTEKKEKKYIHYALMTLLGVFGISGPLIMKTLSIIAGKALIASKIALLIVGSVALKKIFDKDHEHSSVKVLTHTISEHRDDDYDRNINAGAYKFLNTI